MAKLTVRDLKVNGKRVLLRVDYNVPLEEQEGIDDPVRMYLREIGKVYLLSGADEKRLARQMERATAMNMQAVVICTSAVRPAFKKLTDRFIPNVCVLSYDEVLSNVEIRSLGTVELSDAD